MDPDSDEVRGERRGPVLGVAAVAVAIPFFMPSGYTPGSRWLIPLVEVGSS